MRKQLFLLSIFSLVLLFSCKKTQTLQEFLVETDENPNYQSFSISTSMIDNYIKLTNNEDVKETVKSIRKISLVGLPIKGHEQQYQSDKLKLNAIFKTSDNYKPLVKIKKQGINLNLFYKGTTENINEVVVYANSNEYGLGLARISGSNIKTDKIIELLNKENIPDNILEGMKSDIVKVDSNE